MDGNPSNVDLNMIKMAKQKEWKTSGLVNFKLCLFLSQRYLFEVAKRLFTCTVNERPKWLKKVSVYKNIQILLKQRMLLF